MIEAVVREKPEGYQAKKQIPDYDGLWKKLIEDLFNEFTAFFAPNLHQTIDFTKQPEFLNREFYKKIIKEKEGKVIADQIVKVFLETGEEKWILIHVEVQGVPKEDFSKRMFRYFYRIYDYFDREVYAIALITDQQTLKHANGFHYSFYGTKVDYEYNVYTFDPKNISKLEQSHNPFAAAVIAGIYANKSKNDAEKRYKFKRKLMIQILQKYSTQQEEARIYLSALFYFIDNLLLISDEYNRKLTKEVIPYFGKEVAEQMRAEKTDTSQTLEEIFAELREEGKEEGKQEGRQEVSRAFVQELAKENYTNEQIAKLTKLTLKEVALFKEQL
jgi:predicted transposase/invertase (TIGR01784 family)